jgi:MbtH protein
VRRTLGARLSNYDDRDNEPTYLVVLNDEEQYSLLRSDLAIPDGWRPAGKTGGRQECLSFVAEVWTDLRPLSLRLRMDAASGT